MMLTLSAWASAWLDSNEGSSGRSASGLVKIFGRRRRSAKGTAGAHVLSVWSRSTLALNVGRWPQAPLVRWLFGANLALQALTTREPDDEQVQVAIAAVERCVAAERVSFRSITSSAPSFDSRR